MFFIRFVMVILQSLVSGHKVVAIRPRIKEEISMLRYDPHGMYLTFKSTVYFILM